MNKPKRIALNMVAEVTSEYMDRTNSSENNRPLPEITLITNVIIELNEIYLDISKKTFSLTK